MTGPEHYAAAERLIGKAVGRYDTNTTMLAEAQVHGTLALAAATAAAGRTPVSLVSQAWHEAAGVTR